MEQYGLTAISGAVVFGIFIFAIQESIRECQAATKASSVTKISFGATEMAVDHQTSSMANNLSKVNPHNFDDQYSSR